MEPERAMTPDVFMKKERANNCDCFKVWERAMTNDVFIAPERAI